MFLKTTSWVLSLAATAAVSAAGSELLAQACSQCGQSHAPMVHDSGAHHPGFGGGAYNGNGFDAGCADGNCGSAGCSSCRTAFGAQSAQGDRHSDLHAFQDRWDKDYDRNVAWPVPFQMTDRQVYRNYFKPCYDRGWEIEHTLSDACFDSKTGRLNRLGAAKITQVVQAAPKNRKTIFVHQNASPLMASNRVAAVEEFVQYEFGRSAGVAVAVTNNFPTTGAGSYAEAITRSFHSNLPKPQLKTQTVSGAIGN